MGWLLFARDCAELDASKAGGLQPAIQIAFSETKPAIAVQVAGLLEGMTPKIQDQDLTEGT